MRLAYLIRHVTQTSLQVLLSLAYFYIMEPAGDDLRDDLVIDGSIASSEEDESSHFILQDTGDDRAGSSSNAASLLAKKRKRKAKEKAKRAKVRS